MNNMLANSCVTAYQRKALRKGKTKGLGPLEELSLFVAGYKDGKSGYPKPNGADNTDWASAYMEKERRRFLEFDAKIWGHLQSDIPKHLAEVEVLRETVNEINRKIKAFDPAKRKSGEEFLSDGNVRARREREYKFLMDDLVKINKKLILKRHETAGSIYTNEMAVDKVRQHTFERIVAYWRFALRTHPNAKSIPAVPDIQLNSDAEQIFRQNYANLLEEIDALKEEINRLEEEPTQENIIIGDKVS